MQACEEYIELISGGADSELNDIDMARLKEHLETCGNCRALYEFYKSMNSALTQMEEPPAGLSGAVMLSIKTEKKRGGFKRRFAFRSFTAIGAAAAAVLLIISYKGTVPLNTTGGSTSAEPAPQMVMFGAGGARNGFENGGDMSDVQISEPESSSSIMEDTGQPPQIRATSAPAETESNLDNSLVFAAPEAPAGISGEEWNAVAEEILAEHSGEFSRAMLFYGETPLGLDGEGTQKTSRETVYHIVSDTRYTEIEALNIEKNIEFYVIYDNINLNADASEFVIIICADNP